MMNIFSIFRNTLSLIMLLLILPRSGFAEDIDIFTGGSGGAAAAPKIIIMLDNFTSDLFPDKLDAISKALDSITAAAPLNIGLAMWSQSSSPKGAYIRYAPQDVSIAANKTNLQNLLASIKAANEYNGLKDEPEAFYELFKYYSSLMPYTGKKSNNVYADPLAFNADGTYRSIGTTCGRDFIIYIAANNSFDATVSGKQSYEPGYSAGPALPPLNPEPYWGDEWANFNFNNASPQIITYVLDSATAGNNDAAYSTILQQEAKQGGGSYYRVTDQASIQSALLKIFTEVKSVNSSFSSAALPVSTTNRSQNKNQVFIPMFRPDPSSKPLWPGNLKQYQLIYQGNDIVLGDNSSPSLPAINPITGFPTDCAVSFWTTDSRKYWATVPSTPSLAGKCPVTASDPYSDAPDGPFVEKGGVGEVIRKGNNPPSTNTSPTYAVNRTIFTQNATGLVAFNTASVTGASANVVNFILGKDVNDENSNKNLTETRPSLHGDAVHSKPLPIDYGGSTGVITYYGTNDGMMRAIDSANGRELWGFVAPEFNSRLGRLQQNAPLIKYPNQPIPTLLSDPNNPVPKDYFFDGSIGVYQNIDNTKVWIFPTMRRGGRMIYGLDVTIPNSPKFKWKIGCPLPNSDTGCTAGTSGFGQSWSKPAVAEAILGYSGPVLVVGGGYDGGYDSATGTYRCEDINIASPTCPGRKGQGIYIIDANDGTVIKQLTPPTDSGGGSIVADIALVAIAKTGVIDHGYVADTTGNLYRIDFDAAIANWRITKIAFTTGNGRKFFYAPALLKGSNNRVYVALGSGDREHPLQSQYPFMGVINRFYVFLDDLNLPSSSPATNLDSILTMKDYSTQADSTCNTVGLFAPPYRGWFTDLKQYGQGEQTVTSAVVAGGLVFFSTNRPIPPVAGSCTTTLGEARGYVLNLLNGSGAIGVAGSCGGSRSSIFAGGGLPPSPSIGTVPVNGKLVTVIFGAAQRSGAASSPIQAQTYKPPVAPRRHRAYSIRSIDN